MALNIYFGVTLMLCTVALGFSINEKHKNLGYISTTGLLIICDILSLVVLRGVNMKTARDLYLVFYLVYAWMFFCTLWTIVKMYTGHSKNAFLIPVCAVSVLQTVVTIVCFNSPRTMLFTQEIFFGGVWWVASGVPDKFTLFSFPVYLVLCHLSGILNIVFSIVCLCNSPKVFRERYLVLIAFQMGLLVVTVLNFVFRWPMWLLTLIMNPVCYATYYYVFMQSDQKLKSTAIASFANEMSDGLLVYNIYNDLIHANDIIKKVMDEEALEELKSVEFMEDWLAETEIVEGMEVVPYRNGKWTFYYVVTKQILGTDKSFVGTLYTLRDVTPTINQIRLMEEINGQLEQSARMKSDFLANMSHELRTPMNAVIGMAELALREELSPYARDCLSQIKRSGRALLNIINDILDYSKIEAGKMEIVPEKYQPLAEVNDISNILQTRIGDKPIEMFFIVEPNLPKELIGDALRIRQVLINIANNAIKFTEKGAVGIYLTCEKKREDEVILHFHVIDTGIGILKEDLEKIFISFQQLDSKRNRNVEGTGLGLAISQKLCEAMGGTIGIESEYGKGTDVWFDIPQKVADGSRDLVVFDAENKAGFCMNPNDKMTAAFEKEMIAFGLEHRVITSFDEYVPTGKKEYLFIEDKRYGEDVEEFLDRNPELICVVIAGMGVTPDIKKKNVRIMNRPMSTLNIVMILNDQDIMNYGRKEEEVAHFIAPEAKILIVDDNSINLSIAEGLLKPIKAKCTKALSGAEALSILGKEHFDLILMDHMMPVMDGVETSQIIRRDIASASDTPIIALTANVAEGSRELFFKAGMVDIIAKPIEVKKLMEKMHRWLPDEKIKDVLPGTAEQPVEEVKYVPEFDCLDCQKGIEALGSAELFREIVSEYYHKGEKTLAAIEEAREHKDWKDYAIKTHSLKSTSRQIGATELGNMAEKLELAGKAEDMAVIEAEHERTMTAFRALLDALSVYFKENGGTADLETVSDDVLKAVFEELTEACEALDMDMMEACGEKLKKYAYPEDKREIIDGITNAIASLDSTVCEELMKKYGL